MYSLYVCPAPSTDRDRMALAMPYHLTHQVHRQQSKYSDTEKQVHVKEPIHAYMMQQTSYIKARVHDKTVYICI